MRRAYGRSHQLGDRSAVLQGTRLPGHALVRVSAHRDARVVLARREDYG